MRNVGVVVGAAVGGVSQAVTSAAISAETGQSSPIPVVVTSRSDGGERAGRVGRSISWLVG